MPLTVAQVHFGPHKQYSGYLASPHASAALPAVLVLQELWGVDAHIEEVTRRIAQAGYLALAPDMFAREGARPPALVQARVTDYLRFFDALDPSTALDVDKRAVALRTFAAGDDATHAQLEATQKGLFGLARGDAFLPVLQSAAEFVRHRQPGQPLGALGFCIGGHWALRLAAHDSELAAVAVFYGMPPPPDEMAALRCPILGLYGGNDARVNNATQPMAEALRGADSPFEQQVYSGAGHAFFNDTRSSYDLAASRDAFVRLLVFLRDRLAHTATAKLA